MDRTNVGILGIELYIPKTYVDQTELENFDRVGKGKYTVGLGQKNMSVVGDREDINSISSTVVQNLLEKNSIPPQNIGRLEIGTETLIDKSKSTKTVLMNIFRGNESIEGVTVINACYGGIQALFNSVAWVESSAWDGRLAIAVASDIALYEKGPARATGGAGAVAFLVGPNAPLVLEPLRSVYMTHVYDFFKPVPGSEYPVVDGHHSIDCYLEAIANCYNSLKGKVGAKNIEELGDYYCLHAPYYKMVRRAFNKMVLTDILENPKSYNIDLSYAGTPDLKDRKVYNHINNFSQETWQKKCEPGTLLGKECGNIYCGALPAALLSLIYNCSDELLNKRVVMFAYGSGLASSMFRIHVRPDAGSFIEKTKLNNPLLNLLSSRLKLSPQEYTRRMDKREEDYQKNNWTPKDQLEELHEGTFYLVKVDQKWRRYYARKVARPKL